MFVDIEFYTKAVYPGCSAKSFHMRRSMPIEFLCNACSRKLRVPDGTGGKTCCCPVCKTKLLIPQPQSILAADDALNVRIDVACPNCGKNLACDANLDGTRGCCPSCAYVFTIRFDRDPNEIVVEIQSFPFACPRCKQLFEGTPDKLGRRGKCTACSEVFIIEKHEPPKQEQPKKVEIRMTLRSNTPEQVSHATHTKAVLKSPSGASKPLARPQHASKANPTLARPTQSAATGHRDPFSELALHIPEADLAFKPVAYQPPALIAKPSYGKSYTRSRNGSSSGSVVKTVLIVVGCIAGFGVLATCAGVIGFGLYVQSAKQIAAGGYGALAPGMKTKFPIPQEATSGEAVGNPKTYSEFAIIQYRLDPNKPLTVEKYILGLGLSGAIQEGAAVSVTRAGLSGYHYDSKRSGGFPGHTGEILDTPNGMLLLLYITAEQAGKESRFRKSKTPEQIRNSDNPDAFFESMSKIE